MATTEEQIEAIKSAMYSGVLTVQYNGRTITYRSMVDLERALARLTGEQAAAAGTGSRDYAEFYRD